MEKINFLRQQIEKLSSVQVSDFNHVLQLKIIILESMNHLMDKYVIGRHGLSKEMQSITSELQTYYLKYHEFDLADIENFKLIKKQVSEQLEKALEYLKEYAE